MSVQQQQHKARVEQLSKYQGSGTEMVSVYIPEDESLQQNISELQSEQSQAENIKSKKTRKHVTGALGKILSVLQEYPETPADGIAVFAGYEQSRNGYVVEVFDEFPYPIEDSAYHCDKTFYTEPLEEAFVADGDYVLIILDKNDAVVGEVVGTSVRVVDTFSSLVPGKTQKGGFCLAPETKVMDANGDVLTLDSVSVGDEILASNLEGSPITTKVTNKWTSKKETFTIETQQPKLKLEASKDHTVFVHNKNDIVERPVKELEKEDSLLFYNGFEKEFEDILSKSLLTTKVSSIHTTGNDKKEVVDIETDCHNFIANGVVVHNSQQRFERLREEAKENFFKEIAESVNNRYVEDRHELNGIFIGAPEPTKSEFVDGEYLHHELQDKILAETSISTTTEAGLRQLLDECQDVIHDKELTRQREYCERFLTGLSTEQDHIAYGVDETLTALEYGAVETLLVSEQLPSETESLLLDTSTHTDVLSMIQQKAEEYGSEVVFISDSFEEGQQFRTAFGGIGAILRYPIN